MSNATGQVRFEDGLILYFVYGGTVDEIYPKLFESREEAFNAWGDENLSLKNRVSSVADSESVELATNYGGGLVWIGKASRSAMEITDGLRPNQFIQDPDDPFGLREIIDNPTTSGLPDWFI
jgi:hypothetical protein